MKYIVYRDQENDYESFVERFCLRGRVKNPFAEKKELVNQVEFMSREKKRLSTNKSDLNEYLKLLPGEKQFIR